LFLNRIFIKRVRNIGAVDLILEKPVVVVYGVNGSGKSTIVDSLGSCLLARRSSRVLLGPSSLIYLEGEIEGNPFWVEKTKSKTLIHYNGEYVGQQVFKDLISELNFLDQGEQPLLFSARDRIQYLAETFGVLEVFGKIQTLRREVYYGDVKRDEEKLKSVETELKSLPEINGKFESVLQDWSKVQEKKRLMEKAKGVVCEPNLEERYLVARVRQLFKQQLAQKCPVCLSPGPFNLDFEDPRVLRERLDLFRELERLKDVQVDSNTDLLKQLFKRSQLEGEKKVLEERVAVGRKKTHLAEHLWECFCLFLSKIQSQVEQTCSRILQNHTRFRRLSIQNTGVFVDGLHARGLSFGERALVGCVYKLVLMSFFPRIGIFDGFTDFLDKKSREQICSVFSHEKLLHQVLLFSSEKVEVKDAKFIDI